MISPLLNIPKKTFLQGVLNPTSVKYSCALVFHPVPVPRLAFPGYRRSPKSSGMEKSPTLVFRTKVWFYLSCKKKKIDLFRVYFPRPNTNPSRRHNSVPHGIRLSPFCIPSLWCCLVPDRLFGPSLGNSILVLKFLVITSQEKTAW
jgi:hypothetical protein